MKWTLKWNKHDAGWTNKGGIHYQYRVDLIVDNANCVAVIHIDDIADAAVKRLMDTDGECVLDVQVNGNPEPESTDG